MVSNPEWVRRTIIYIKSCFIAALSKSTILNLISGNMESREYGPHMLVPHPLSRSFIELICIGVHHFSHWGRFITSLFPLKACIPVRRDTINKVETEYTDYQMVNEAE